MLFTMWLNLYATRLVLQNLGVDDMGVYGVVGGIVNLFVIFTSGIINTVQRFITFEMGRNEGGLNTVFCTILNVILLLSFIIFILLETLGIWFLYNKINIPSGSEQQAFWVFQFSVLTCIVNLISIPYNALVIAHEKMDAYAFISIIQVVLTCCVAWSLSLINNQRLFAYAALMALVSVIVRVLYQVYCHINFHESHYHIIINRDSIKQIGKFAGVTTVAGILETVYNQLVVLVINWLFGVAINAVYSIALQLKNAVLSFSLNIFKAVSPQITKTYASGELNAHKRLVYWGSKLEAYMIFFIMIPFLFRTKYILNLWLGEAPPYTVEFVQAIVFISLTYAILEPIRASVMATGKINRFMLIPNMLYLVLLPLCYLVTSWTFNPVLFIVIIVIIDIIACIYRVYYALKVVSVLKLKEIIWIVMYPSAKVVAICSLICWGLSNLTEENILGFCLLFALNSISICLVIYATGINIEERNIINKFANQLIIKVWKR